MYQTRRFYTKDHKNAPINARLLSNEYWRMNFVNCPHRTVRYTTADKALTVMVRTKVYNEQTATLCAILDHLWANEVKGNWVVVMDESPDKGLYLKGLCTWSVQ